MREDVFTNFLTEEPIVFRAQRCC